MNDPRIKIHRKGQGLLETIIALTILVTGAVSLIVLVVASSTARALAENQTIAANLAREGIEVVRNVRDTNWIQGLAFDAGLTAPGNDYTFAAQFDPQTNAWTLFAGPNTINDNATVMYLYTTGVHTGVFTQSDVGAPAGSTVMPFRRLITLDEICSAGGIATSGTNCAAMGGQFKIGIRATVDMQWSERGRTHSISIEERLYDWR